MRYPIDAGDRTVFTPTVTFTPYTFEMAEASIKKAEHKKNRAGDPVVLYMPAGVSENYGGQWGNIEEFHKLSQEYSLQIAENEAAEFTLQGWTVERQKQDNGDILLVIQQ